MTRTSVALPQRAIDLLKRFGARPDRGRGPFNRSNVLARHMDLYAGLIHNSDPREGGFSEDFYAFTMSLLVDPWSIRAQDLPHLPGFLKALPSFKSLAAERAIDPAAYLRAVESLPYAQRLFLLASAEERYGPAASSEP